MTGANTKLGRAMSIPIGTVAVSLALTLASPPSVRAASEVSSSSHAKSQGDQLSRLSIREGNDGSTVVRIRGAIKPTFNAYRLQGPERLVIDLANTMRGPAVSPDVLADTWACGRVTTDNVDVDGATLTRVSIELKRASSYYVIPDGTELVITIAPRQVPPETYFARQSAEARRVELEREREQTQRAKSEALVMQREAQALHRAAQERATVANAQLREAQTQAERAQALEAEAAKRAARAREHEAKARARVEEAVSHRGRARQTLKDATAERAKAERARARAQEATKAARVEVMAATKAAERRRAEAEEALKLAEERARQMEAQAHQRLDEANVEAQTTVARAEQMATAKVARAERQAKATIARAEAVATKRLSEAGVRAQEAEATVTQRLAEAEHTVERAEEQAARMLGDARRQADRSRERARASAQATEAEADAKAEHRLQAAERTARATLERADAEQKARRSEAEHQASLVLAMAERRAAEQVKRAKAERKQAHQALERAQRRVADADRRADETVLVAQVKAKKLVDDELRAARVEAQKLVATARQQAEQERVEQLRIAQAEAVTTVEVAEAKARELVRQELAEAEQEAKQRVAKAEAQHRRRAAARARQALEDLQARAQRDADRAAQEARVSAKAQAQAELAEAKQAIAREAEAKIRAAVERAEAAESRATSSRADAEAKLEQAEKTMQEAEQRVNAAQALHRAAEQKLVAVSEAQPDAKPLRKSERERAHRKANTDARATSARVSALGDVRIEGRDADERVVIAVNGEFTYEHVSLTPTVHLLKFPGLRLPKALAHSLDARVNPGPIKMVTTYREEASTKVVVSTTEPSTISIDEQGDGLVARFARRSSTNEPASRPVAAAVPASIVAGTSSALPIAAAEPVVSTFDEPPTSVDGTRSQRRRWQGDRIDIELQAAPAKDVLLLFSDIGNVNIIAGRGVEGEVTLKLVSVPWDQALDIILRSLGLGSTREGNVIRVAPLEELERERQAAIERANARVQLKPLETRLVPISYATVAEMVPKVQTVLSPRGSVTPDQRTNTLIIMDVAENIQVAEQLVQSLDSQTPQVLIEARIVEARTTFQRQLGIQWGFDFVASPGTGNPTGLLFPNSLGVGGGATGGQADVRGILLPGSAANPNYAVDMPAPVGTGAGGAIGFSFGSISGNLNTNLRLSAAETTGEVRIISAPKIVTLDNSSAQIEQGVQIPISQVSAQGVNTRFVNASLSLQVTPHVTNEGAVLLDVTVQKNEADFVNTGARGDPTILTRQAQSRMLVNDNDTAVIGGIYTRNKAVNYTKVPWLADIPIIGWFFKTKSEADTRSEVLIFLTPKIVNRASSIGGG